MRVHCEQTVWTPWPCAEVVAAFDINPNANDVYEHNFGKRPLQRNLFGLPAAQFDKLGASVWLMSPPCQPFTRQAGGVLRTSTRPTLNLLLFLRCVRVYV